MKRVHKNYLVLDDKDKDLQRLTKKQLYYIVATAWNLMKANGEIVLNEENKITFFTDKVKRL